MSTCRARPVLPAAVARRAASLARPAALAVAAALAFGVGAARAAAAPGAIDAGFGSGATAVVPFGLGARAAGLALAPDGRIVVAGDRRGAGGEGALTARFTPSGVLDTTFAGMGGRVDTFGDGATPQRAGAVAVQADGATLTAGVAGDRWMLARYLANGLSDGLFGAAGVTLRDPVPGSGPDETYPEELPALPDGTGPAAIAVAADGKIVVAGNVGVENDDGVPGEQIVVARFGPTGVPDPTFGRDGFSVLQLGFGGPIRHAASAARSLSLLPDGRILLAGRASSRDGGDRALVARLTTAGRLDKSFARQGRLIEQLGWESAARAASSSLATLVQRPDGRLLAAGRATDVAGNHATLLAGFTAGGALDTTFGRRGSVLAQLGAPARTVAPSSQARALALAPDGTALVAGAATGGSPAARLGSNGALDCGYGSRGRAPAFGAARSDPSSDGPFAAALQPGGGLLVAGRRAGGGLLLGRLLGGPSAIAVTPLRARVTTLAARYTGRGRGYAYGLVDGGCRTVRVRFVVTAPGRRSIATKLQLALGRSGPQVVCAPLTGLRAAARYAIRIAAVAGGPRGEQRVLRTVAAGSRKGEQQGCG